MDGEAAAAAHSQESEAPAAAASLVMVENEAESIPVKKEVSVSSCYHDLETCPVCHLKFYCREPRILPCLHSFCKRCLPPPSRNLSMSELPQTLFTDRAAKPLNVICCPVCRQECMEGDVMANIFVKDSDESPSSTVERTVQLCMTCDDNTEAAGFCVDCVEYLCATCVEAHQRVKFTKDHNIKQKPAVLEDGCGPTTQRPMFCDIHKQEPLKLFCETCDQITCRDCQLTGHKNHSYQFLEDAFKNHKQHMESLTLQLQEKKKLVDDVSNYVEKRILQVVQNRTSVQEEIKKSICSLILEINKKGEMLFNQLEAVTKDHERVLRKQQEDIGYLSRHLDHILNFTKWATAKNGAMAFFYRKRLILFQIEKLLQAKCSNSFLPQSTVRFQCQSSLRASNVDLGSILIEKVPGDQLLDVPHQLTHQVESTLGSNQNFGSEVPLNTLAQLQRQVDKLNSQASGRPQPHRPIETLYQSIQLPPTFLRPMHPPQQSHRTILSPSRHISPISSPTSSGLMPKRELRSSAICQSKPLDIFSSSPFYTHSSTSSFNSYTNLSQSAHKVEYVCQNKRKESDDLLNMLNPNHSYSLPSPTKRNVQGQHSTLGSIDTSFRGQSQVFWDPLQTLLANEAVRSSDKKRQKSSPGPATVIKDEPENGSYCI
ncbi:transcription intermediary factor 1-alpha-like [Cynoglossus semilaevis]|uniref:Transcription intermediary factor 1-alpha-like n=1 Tax=Cynoglossus semilaevis TaxID=244447 RepID=A0A3P8VIJ8_CYNSE|nr:transcription intermediary factor 1-alpha-like [Cynoglossus semilaevis]